MNSRQFKSSEVFTPYNFPDYTYITRESTNGIDYEDRLNFALNMSGALISINGASKMGKTVLCDKVIPFDKQVSISGVDFNEDDDFWDIIAKKVCLPIEGHFREELKISDSERQSKMEIYKLTKDRVIEHFIQENKVLILDDFHYAPTEVQKKIACHLKDAIRKSFKAIIISLPHRSDAPIRNNSDLSGRLSLIDIEMWKIDDLKGIIRKGFQQLNVSISDEIVEQIAVESLTSPQLTQFICLSICMLLNIDNQEVLEINEEILKKAYKYTTINFGYLPVINLLSRGPLSKGKKRNVYNTKLGIQMDLYQLFIESLAVNPPLMGQTIDQIKDRIHGLVIDQSKPDRQKIKSTIVQIEKLIQEQDNLYKVFEYKDDVVYITEPLFLFFLRWGRICNG